METPLTVLQNWLDEAYKSHSRFFDTNRDTWPFAWKDHQKVKAKHDPEEFSRIIGKAMVWCSDQGVAKNAFVSLIDDARNLHDQLLWLPAPNRDEVEDYDIHDSGFFNVFGVAYEKTRQGLRRLREICGDDSHLVDQPDSQGPSEPVPSDLAQQSAQEAGGVADPVAGARTTPLNVRDLLAHFKLPIDENTIERLEKRLARFRKKNQGCYAEIDYPRRGYLYYPEMVRSVLESLKASLDQPSKKKSGRNTR